MEQKRVLIVDDEKIICSLSVEYFSRAGYNAQWAGTKKDALELFRTFKPHAVLLDIFLPDASGLDVLSAMLELDPQVKVCMISGLHDLSFMTEAVNRGAKEYYGKPLDYATLVKDIDEMIGR